MASFFSPQLKRLLGYVRPYWPFMAAGVSLLAIVAVADGVVGLLIAPVFDRVLNPSSADSNVLLFRVPISGKPFYVNHLFPHSIHNVWTVVVLSLLIVYAIRSISEFAGVATIQYVGHRAITDLRNGVYSRIIRQPIGFFQQQSAGRIFSAVINDVERARLAISEYLAELFLQAFHFPVYLAILLYFDWKMTLACAFLLPIIVWPIAKLGKRIRRSVETSQTRLGELTQILQETVSGNRIVKAFGMEDFEISKFRMASRRLLRETMRWVTAQVATSPLMDMLQPIVVGLLLLYARDRIRAGVLTPGIFLAFVYAIFKTYEPIKRIGAVYQQFQQAQGATTQVFAFLDMAQEEHDAAAAKELPAFEGLVEFDGVSFSYDSSPVLRDISLAAKKGEVIALVGSSGAGKTTLVNLLPRFYDVTSGRILIDGTDIRDVRLRSLRSQIAMVTQENILFHDTVWNNICYGLTGVAKEQVVAAAQAALAHDFIQELPSGYATIIGERGTRLSGGQRQRIAIARAILKDSPILILDEATSELDAESEAFVQKALANLMVGRTTFVIAHRLATVRRADKILVLEDGQIRESGTHAELLARGGTYARLHELQFADDEVLAPTPSASAEQPPMGESR
ncbi:MAG: lipid A export permease/ATP-binding protein MsbA [Candidatus Acidiferrum sp.]